MRQTLAIEAILIWVYNRLIPALLGLGAIIGLWYLGQAMERPVYDLLLRWSAKPNTDSPVTLVLIDDASILRLSSGSGDALVASELSIDVSGRECQKARLDGV